MRGFVVIALLIAGAVAASAQTSSQAKAEAVAAAFSKNKHVIKEKYGIRREKFKDVRCVPAVRQNVAEYSGSYEVPDLGYVVNIQVGSDGSIQANGQEAAQRSFRLENAKIDGALLTGTKVYQDGATERFEGVFLNRTDREVPAAPGVTIFGLGVILETPFEINGLTYDKLFYVVKP